MEKLPNDLLVSYWKEDLYWKGSMILLACGLSLLVTKVLLTGNHRKSTGEDQLDYSSSSSYSIYILISTLMGTVHCVQTANITPLHGGVNHLTQIIIDQTQSCHFCKMLQLLFSKQLKSSLQVQSVLNTDFREKHNTALLQLQPIPAAITAIDTRRRCVALFVDLTKAFYTVDHPLQLRRLCRVVFSIKLLTPTK